MVRRLRNTRLGRAAALAPHRLPRWLLVAGLAAIVVGLLAVGGLVGGYSGETGWVVALVIVLAVVISLALGFIYELELRRRGAAGLAAIGLTAADGLDRPRGMDDVIRGIRSLLDVDRVVVLVVDENGALQVDAAFPADEGDRIQRTLAEVVRTTSTPAVVTLGTEAEVQRAWGDAAGAATVAGVAWIPAVSRGRVVGVVGVASRSARRLSPSHGYLFHVTGRLVGSFIDSRRLVARLETQASLDGLTGVLNRSALDRRLEATVVGAHRRGHDLCVAMMDLDRFKDFNDRHGHLAGDRLLKEVAAALQAGVRRNDVVGRFGGEEFLMVFDGVGIPDALAALGRIRRAMPPGVTASVGVAGLRPGEPAQGLVQRADEALYAAKRDGRDRVVVAA